MSQPKPATIDEYIATQPAERQPILQKIRQTIQQALPDATETMSYGMPTFDLNGYHLLYFSAWKDHVGVYPLYTDGGELKELLAPYRKEKNSLHIPYDDPALYEVIAAFATLRQQEEAAQPSH